MTAAAGVPARPLVLLALAVLAAHVLVLQVSPPTLSWVTLAARAPPVVHMRMAQPMASAPPALPTQVPHPVARSPAPTTIRPPAKPAAQATPPPAPPSAIAAPTALEVPEAARWRYMVRALHRGILLEGQASLDWMPSAGAYEAALSIDVAGLPRREQRSTGEVAVAGLRPLRFSDRVRGEQAAHFDHQAGQLVFSGNQPSTALQPGAQDRVSVVLQLLALARAEPQRMEPGTSVTMQVTGARGADAWTFVVDRRETLDLPAGPVQALKLTRSPMREYDVRMELWIAPDYGPVRLRLTPPNGDWLDMQWSGTDKR